jgi:hypothetical protein
MFHNQQRTISSDIGLSAEPWGGAQHMPAAGSAMLTGQGLVSHPPGGALEHPLAPYPLPTGAYGQLPAQGHMGLYAGAGDAYAQDGRGQQGAVDAAAEGGAQVWDGMSVGGDGALQMRLPHIGPGVGGYEDDGLIGYEQQQQQPGDAGA